MTGSEHSQTKSTASATSKIAQRIVSARVAGSITCRGTSSIVPIRLRSRIRHVCGATIPLRSSGRPLDRIVIFRVRNAVADFNTKVEVRISWRYCCLKAATFSVRHLNISVVAALQCAGLGWLHPCNQQPCECLFPLKFQKAEFKDATATEDLQMERK